MKLTIGVCAGIINNTNTILDELRGASVSDTAQRLKDLAESSERIARLLGALARLDAYVNVFKSVEIITDV